MSPGRIRAFVSISLPEDLRREIGLFAGEIRQWCGDVRWERPENLHCTVKFLGDIEASTAEAAHRALQEAAAGVESFEMTLAGFGAFPSTARPKVLWIGCADRDGSLPRLHASLEGRLAALGFPNDDRAFHPHVTIARVREHGHRTYLTSIPKSINFEPRYTRVREIFLMRSTLRPGGSEYHVIGAGALA